MISTGISFFDFQSTLIFYVKSKLNFLCQMLVFVRKPIRMMIKFDKIFLLIELNAFMVISEAVNFQISGGRMPVDPLDNLAPLAIIELVLHMS